jgi:hypothetical protein
VERQKIVVRMDPQVAERQKIVVRMDPQVAERQKIVVRMDPQVVLAAVFEALGLLLLEALVYRALDDLVVAAS